MLISGVIKPQIRTLQKKWARVARIGICTKGLILIEPPHTSTLLLTMCIVNPFSSGYVQQDIVRCHKAHIISSWFHEHDCDFSLFQRPAPDTKSKSPDTSNRALLGMWWNRSFAWLKSLQKEWDSIKSSLTQLPECYSTLLKTGCEEFRLF